jgi:hypothetical protein
MLDLVGLCLENGRRFMLMVTTELTDGSKGSNVSMSEGGR